MKTIAWWTISILVLVFGAVGFVASAIVYIRIPAEGDLTYVKGVPRDIATPGGGEVKYVVRFTIDDYRIEHPRMDKSYSRILRAVQSREPVRAGIASLTAGTPKKGEISTLYTLTTDDREIRSYEQMLEEEWVPMRAGLISGVVLFCVGAVSTFLCYRHTKRRRQVVDS